jgi:hypothetical protein
MLEGMTRRGGTACRMERQALHNAIQRFNAEGPDGLHDRPLRVASLTASPQTGTRPLV